MSNRCWSVCGVTPMTPDVNTVEVDLPTTISAYVVANCDNSFTIVLNARMSYEHKRESYLHELGHIQNGDYDKESADLIEIHAHAVKPL